MRRFDLHIAGRRRRVLVSSRTALSLQNPAPYFSGVQGNTPEAVDPALAVSFLHWGFLAWALVATTVTISFSILERRGEPLRPRTLLVGVLPRGWVDGPLGDLADGLSVVAAIAGAVGPLGFLSLQLSNAAGQLPWLQDSAGLQSLVVVLLTAVFTASLNGERHSTRDQMALGIECLAHPRSGSNDLAGRAWPVADPALPQRDAHLPRQLAADGTGSQWR